ncbi:MAG: hypothetical protein ABIE07_03680 [Candidatus Zixiibacteriota bacterium]
MEQRPNRIILAFGQDKDFKIFQLGPKKYYRRSELEKLNMYKIEETYYGYHTTFSGVMSEAEALRFKSEVKTILSSQKQPWSSVVDLQAWIPAGPEILMLLRHVEQLTKKHGLQRRAVIVRSPVIKAQATQLSFASETNSYERRIDASKVDNWEEQAIAWAAHGVEPVSTFSVVSSD